MAFEFLGQVDFDFSISSNEEQTNSTLTNYPSFL